MADTKVAQALYGIRFLEELASAPSNLGEGRIGLWADTDGKLRFGNSSSYSLLSTSNTLPALYAAGATSADSRILLDSTRAGLWVKDASPTVGVILFAVTDLTESSFYLSVRTTRTLITNAAASGASASPALRVAPGAHVNTTASTEIIDFDFDANRTVQLATGALATNRSGVFRAPTLSFVGASTVTNAATLAITGAPVQGTNATITNAHALWVQAGMTTLAGGLAVDDSFGIFGQAPVGQQTAAGVTTGFTAGAGTAARDDSTYTGGIGSTAYTVGDLVALVKTFGFAEL